MAGLADAAQREAAWLNTHGDGLPALPLSAGGKWGIVQAFWPGAKLATQKTGLYVQVGVMFDNLPVAQRERPQYEFRVKAIWPLKTGTTAGTEAEQANLAAALADVVTRIRGPFNDHTHSGRFLSIAQVPAGAPLQVQLADPEQTLPVDRTLRATLIYRADDLEVIG